MMAAQMSPKPMPMGSPVAKRSGEYQSRIAQSGGNDDNGRDQPGNKVFGRQV